MHQNSEIERHAEPGSAYKRSAKHTSCRTLVFWVFFSPVHKAIKKSFCYILFHLVKQLITPRTQILHTHPLHTNPPTGIPTLGSEHITTKLLKVWKYVTCLHYLKTYHDMKRCDVYPRPKTSRHAMCAKSELHHILSHCSNLIICFLVACLSSSALSALKLHSHHDIVNTDATWNRTHIMSDHIFGPWGSLVQWIQLCVCVAI